MDPTSANYELRMLGQARDDEDDTAVDREELFRSSAAGSGMDDRAAAAGAEHAAPSESTDVDNNKKRKKTKSSAWNNFGQIFEVRRGKEVRVSAKCKHCKKLYSGISTDGTRHLIRHIPKCPVLRGRGGAQSLLKFNPKCLVG